MLSQKVSQKIELFINSFEMSSGSQSEYQDSIRLTYLLKAKCKLLSVLEIIDVNQEIVNV